LNNIRGHSDPKNICQIAGIASNFSKFFWGRPPRPPAGARAFGARFGALTPYRPLSKIPGSAPEADNTTNLILVQNEKKSAIEPRTRVYTVYRNRVLKWAILEKKIVGWASLLKERRYQLHVILRNVIQLSGGVAICREHIPDLFAFTRIAVVLHT